jgi:formate dehydrogenase gamma subunit
MSEHTRYQRFTLLDRFEHWILTFSFTTLAVTGLVQKYASAGISQSIIDILGGIESVRIIHRYAAILLMLEVVYHLGVVGYRILVRRAYLDMLPGLDDIQAAIQAIQFNLGLRDDRPQQGRYTFEEKAEYWAVVWGTLIMVVTGFMLWNPIATAEFLPGEIIPAAKVAHGGEAVLASLAIIVWHLYGVHVKIFNKSIFTGHLDEEEMLHEHPLELARIKAGMTDRSPEAQALRRRRRAFFAGYAVLAVVLLIGIYWFVTFEESAITTVPPAENVVVFVPLTPTPLPTPLPTPTPRPTATPEPTPEPGEPTVEVSEVVVWNDIADLFQQKCVACHSESNALGGLNLSDYQATMAGGESGATVQPGEPGDSSLVTVQEAGGHPGQFTEEELSQIRQWIEDGALEAQPSEAQPSGTEAEEVDVTWADVTGLFDEKCVTCHSAANPLGGLDLSDYQAALSSIEPGDAGASSLVTIQEAGGHPGQFSEAELETIRQWIEGGAPEAQPAGAQSPDTETEAADIKWTDVSGLFEEKCVMCHSAANPLGGLDLSDYQATLSGGDSGAIVEPGDPAASSLVTIQDAGGHPGQFTEEELETIRQWIEAGAEE